MINKIDDNGNLLSEEQLKFFAESKLTRCDSLMIFYHASNKDFKYFDEKYIGSGNGGGLFGEGFYFSYREELAKQYGSNIKKVYLNLKKPFDYYNPDDCQKLLDKIDELGLKHDKFMDVGEMCESDIIDELDNVITDDRYTTAYGDQEYSFTWFVKKMGYDGIVAGDEIIAFHSNQIRDVDDKNPFRSKVISRDNGR